ncbi:MAG: hypothetical protein LAO09_23850 [Acidobacteriia bacterium]|nr:hypothetical protein [Terriglobia bacterium]
MPFKFFFKVVVISLSLLSSAHATSSPEDELVATVKIVLRKSFNTDWEGLEQLPKIKWAPLPPTMLQNCLPDGGCFTRQGTATIGGRNLMVIATGARTIVSNLYFRNMTAPFGEAAVVAALKQAGFSTDLARCPVKNGIGGTNWYRLKSTSTNPGYLSIQSSCNGRPCEGFTLTQGEDLPRLQPNQLRLYSEQCSGTVSDRKPVSTVMPHEQLAQMLVALLPPATGPALYDWKTLPNLASSAQWFGAPKKGDLSYKGDPNPWMLTGTVTFSGRQVSLLASGSPTQVKTIYFDESGQHPSGEDVLGRLRTQGQDVRLARCGPVYTESTNNWYSVTSVKSRPVMLRQSLHYDGKQVSDSYELRLDATLPKRDPRDRDPGVGGCKE